MGRVALLPGEPSDRNRVQSIGQQLSKDSGVGSEECFGQGGQNDKSEQSPSGIELVHLQGGRRRHPKDGIDGTPR